MDEVNLNQENPEEVQATPTAPQETAPVPPSGEAVPAPVAPVAESAPSAAPKITLDQLVNLCIEKEASDVHFREGGRVALRVGGKIVFVENIDVLSKEETESMINDMMPNAEEKKRLERDREIDFSYTHTNGVNFRVNAFYQRGKLAGVMRMISKHVPTLEELGIPEGMKNFLDLREGLILITGAAGSGKSTTTQAILRYINENFVKHVLTIENPIEYVFEDKKSMFTQRELGKDTVNMVNALKSAVREDANVVMISEITDYKSLDQVLNLVETGHLVISTMLTRDATQTIERMLSFYPQDLKEEAQERISTDLVAVMAQDLVERQDQQGLVAVFELMFMSQSIKNIIRRGQLVQLRTAIQSSAEEGMITMDAYAYQLAEQGVISQTQVNEFIQREE